MKKLSPTLVELVTILNDGAWHDGDTIGAKLGITRSAVWKAIKKLEGYGVLIESVKSKGYALAEPLMLLEEQYLKKRIAQDIEIFESIDSTNKYLKNEIGKQQIKLCLAEQQTAGKGRLNRSWNSPFGQNIYLSCLYSFNKDISELAGLTLVVGLALIKVLAEYKVFLKWPNDILYQGKKLCGVLVEIQAESYGLSNAIIGIGLNVNMLAGEMNQPWTSLREITGNYYDRNQLCAELVNHLFSYLAKFNTEGFAPFMAEWRAVDSLFGKKIAINNFDNIIHGLAKGINEQGNLLLELENGQIKAFSAGDTSIVKK